MSKWIGDNTTGFFKLFQEGNGSAFRIEDSKGKNLGKINLRKIGEIGDENIKLAICVSEADIRSNFGHANGDLVSDYMRSLNQQGQAFIQQNC